MNLKTAREERGVSQHALARQIGMHQTVISQIEMGQKTPNLDEISVFEEYFDQEIDWKDSRTEDERQVVLNAMIQMSRRLPLESVLKFGLNLVTNRRIPNICEWVDAYSDALNRDDPLLPLEFQQEK